MRKKLISKLESLEYPAIPKITNIRSSKDRMVAAYLEDAREAIAVAETKVGIAVDLLKDELDEEDL